MSFKTEFEKTADLNPTPVPPEVSGYYQVIHSPAVAAATAALKFGTPAAALAAVGAPAGKRLPVAALVGLGVGAIAGAAAASEQMYSNMLERAHLMYHLKGK